MKTTKEKYYRSYSIDTQGVDKTPCNTKTLDQVIDRLEYATKRNVKVLCVRLDIRQPAGSSKSIRSDMPRILENIERTLEREWKEKPNKPNMQFIWRSERAKSENEHVHCLFIVNGNAIRNGWRLQRIANEAVKNKYGVEYDGLVHFCESNGKRGLSIYRKSKNYQEEMDKAVNAGSYLAKTRYDKNRAKGARISSASRLPR